MNRSELIAFGSDYVSRRAERIKNESEQLLAEAEAARNKELFRRLFSGQITPAAAARTLEVSFRKRGLEAADVTDRLAPYHQMFQEGNFPLNQRQKVAWDDMVICLENTFEVTEEERISNNRLVPVGTPSFDPDFGDLAF